MSRKTDVPRMKWIPEMQKLLVEQLGRQGVAAPVVERAIQRWNDDQEPETPLERGCFEVFRAMEADVNRKAGA